VPDDVQGTDSAPEREFPTEADFLQETWWNFPLGKRIVRGANDDDGRLVPAFQPTRFELVVLAQFYVNYIWEFTYLGEIEGYSSVDWQAFEAFAMRRLDTIESMLGEATFHREIDPIDERWKGELAEARKRREPEAHAK
jgi:hypothetical protein